MKRDIRIIGKERQTIDVGKFVLALVAIAEQRTKDMQLELPLNLPRVAPTQQTRPPAEPELPVDVELDQLAFPLDEEDER